jgi:hypothetical protein
VATGVPEVGGSVVTAGVTAEDGTGEVAGAGPDALEGSAVGVGFTSADGGVTGRAVAGRMTGSGVPYWEGPGPGGLR